MSAIPPVKTRMNNGLKMLLTLACSIAVIAGLKAGKDFFVPILLALFLATISYPITQFFQKLRLGRGLSVFLTVLIDCSFIFAIAIFANYLAQDLAGAVQNKYQPLFNDRFQQLEDFATAQGIEDVWRQVLETIKETINPSWLTGILTNLLGKAATLIALTFAELILMTFFLAEAPLFRRNIEAVLNAQGPDFHRFIDASKDLQRYLAIKTLISLLTGLSTWLICSILGIDFALLWAILAFTLNYIPTIGSIVAAIPPIALAFLVHGWGYGTVAAISFVVINIFLGQFIEPMFYGYRFGMPTSIILISVLFWGWIWGPTGMLLAVPLTMLAKVAFENSSDLRWISLALGKTQLTQEKFTKKLTIPRKK